MGPFLFMYSGSHKYREMEADITGLLRYGQHKITNS